MANKKHDWLGICLEMMTEYYPVEVQSKADAEKYWSISEHLMRVLEYTKPKYRYNGDKELDRHNDLVKDMVRLFAQNSMDSIKTIESDTEADEICDNVTLNNLLLLNIFG